MLYYLNTCMEETPNSLFRVQNHFRQLYFFLLFFGQFNITSEHYKYLGYVFLRHTSLFLISVVIVGPCGVVVVTESKPHDAVGNVNQWDKRDATEQGIWGLLQFSSSPR